MDIATLVGMIGAIGFVIMAMIIGSSGDPAMFADLVSVLIVVGGSIFVVIAKFTMGQFLGAGKEVRCVFNQELT